MENNEDMFAKRLIGKMGNGQGPTVVFTAGIHGNEPSGVMALHDLMGVLRANKDPLIGNFYALAGNLGALRKGIRYSQEDLNRIWTTEKIDRLKELTDENANPEQREQAELYEIISEILETEAGPFYFIDLHTTSGETQPFLTINDALINRKFAERFSLPVILGIEEYLHGPLLSYINELGYVACGFEAGTHDSPDSYSAQLAYILLTLEVCGLMNPRDLVSFQELTQALSEVSHDFFEISYRYAIEVGEEFTMKSGFRNFEQIAPGELLAWSGGTEIEAPSGGQIFMPLYQKQGDDGFFIIKRLNRPVLWLSKLLRKIKFDAALTLLPGVRWSPDKTALEVDFSVARFMAKDFFHLLGYRSIELTPDHFRMTSRERTARSEDYANYL